MSIDSKKPIEKYVKRKVSCMWCPDGIEKDDPMMVRSIITDKGVITGNFHLVCSAAIDNSPTELIKKGWVKSRNSFGIPLTMRLDDYIKTRYGTNRGAQTEFLRDNPGILAQYLTRWKRAHCVHLETGEIYKSATQRVALKIACFPIKYCTKKTIRLDDYIKTRYGTLRGAQSDFLRDNPQILAQYLTRWKRAHFVHLETGEIYKVASKKVALKNAK